LSINEFKKGIKMINLDITDGEIDKIAKIVDPNNIGRINYSEFASYFRDN
jgi:Ca2+-binding EF-hand superfamily protein